MPPLGRYDLHHSLREPQTGPGPVCSWCEPKMDLSRARGSSRRRSRRLKGPVRAGGSGCGGCLPRLGLAAEGDLVAHGAQRPDEAADPPGRSGAGRRTSLRRGPGTACRGWTAVLERAHLGVADGDADFGLAAFAEIRRWRAPSRVSVLPAATEVSPVTAPMYLLQRCGGAGLCGAGLLVQRGAPGPGGQVAGGQRSCRGRFRR